MIAFASVSAIPTQFFVSHRGVRGLG
jgi:hypothetical protein